jgi:hypothetical protein
MRCRHPVHSVNDIVANDSDRINQMIHRDLLRQTKIMNTQPDTSNIQGKIQVMEAFAKYGRVVIRGYGNDAVNYNPSWSWDLVTYEIHPDDLNPPHPCQHILDAMDAGKRVRIIHTSGHRSEWSDKTTKLAFDLPPDRYEIEPDPQPWTQEDVPPLCWIRMKDCSDSYLVTTVTTWGITGSRRASFAELAKDFEFSTDLKTWAPCTKPAPGA